MPRQSYLHHELMHLFDKHDFKLNHGVFKTTNRGQSVKLHKTILK